MRVLFLVLATIAVVSAHPQTRKLDASSPSHVLMEVDALGHEHHTEWHQEGHPHAEELIQLTFAIKLSNLNLLEETLLRVSDPRHEDYGKHLSFEQVNQLVRPADRSVRVVMQWLLSSGVPEANISTTTTGDFVHAVVRVSLAEVLLRAKYARFRHSTAKHSSVLRLKHSYSLPHTVAEHVDFVSPTVRFPRVKSLKLSKTDDNALVVTPSFLRQLYQVGDFKGRNSSDNIQAVASFLEQYYSPTDLQTFFALFQNTSLGHTVTKEIGQNVPSNPGTEAELDVQYIMSVGANIQTWVYYTAGRNPNNPENEPFLAWLVNVTDSQVIPNVFSVSYGEDEKSVGFDYAVRVNAEFQKLGVRGTSIMVASGDSGAGGNCSSTGRLSPDFPSGSPWITAVGGVVGGTPGSTPTGETADLISGGGFSDYWPTPDWQASAVKHYLTSKGLPPTAAWNQSGRGYPDVAAQSENFLVVTFGIPLPVSGTSAASPSFAGVVSLLNDVRIAAGKSPLGFLNPFIYQTASTHANSFNDVTFGSNLGCGAGGFPAVAGWDAATGWGSPNFAILSKVAAEL